MLYTFDQRIYEEKYTIVAGLDEAGRGPLAGPVCAAAVVLSMKEQLPGLNDSKKLTPKKRAVLYDLIVKHAIEYSIAWASEEEIDEINILQASLLAMRRAVDGLERRPDYLLVDGNQDPHHVVQAQCVVKGDATSASIAAASILAKVARDRYVEELDAQYPQYGFAQHKGYPTKLHYQRLDEYGPSPVHRKTFLKKWEAKQNETK